MADQGQLLMASGRPANVRETINNACAPSTRRLYFSNFKVFESWYTTRAVDPVSCPVGSVLEFLQDKFVVGAGCDYFEGLRCGCCSPSGVR